MSHIENLKLLRNNLANKRMSLLVGAGFSKNVSTSFPDWVQLLQDLVYELYQEEIDNRLHSALTIEQREKQLFTETKKIIEKVGYLKIVSEYISRKGYEEAIVTYIEKHIPIIEDDDRKYYLINNDGSREELTEKKLYLHKFLLSFPWNNVFTTNYDPLLEASVDTRLHTTLKEKNDQHLKSINELNTKIKAAREEEQKISSKLNDLDNILNSSELKVYPSENTGVLEEPNTEGTKYSKRLKELNREIMHDESDMHSIQRLYAINETQADNSYTLVTDGGKLSLKKNKNIIKLHGSLRSLRERNEHKFDFDNDPRKQYIISAEHYTHYPSKHEAFTQLMRIALLQESFCLIGFSGVDPNFTAWIGWVRDLLYRSDRRGSEHTEYKIYLIEMSDGNLNEDDRQLYYENHRIAKIPLLCPEVIHFLEEETKQNLNKSNSYSSALELLFEFLASHDSILLPVTPKDYEVDDEWQKIWKDIALLNKDKTQFIVNENVVNKISKQVPLLAAKIVVPDLSRSYAYDQYRLFELVNSHSLNKLSNSAKENTIKLMVLLLSKLFLPIRSMVTEETLAIMESVATVKKEVLKLLETNNVLTNPSSSLPTDPFNKALQYAFTFNYKGLQEHIIGWDAPLEELHVKAGFLAQFNPRSAIELLEQQLASGKINEQQKMFSNELLTAIKWGSGIGGNERIQYRIEQYKKAGYLSFIEALSNLADSLDKKQSDTAPYGNGRFSTSENTPPNNPWNRYVPLQFLSLLIRFGFPLQAGYTTLITRDRWYKIFKAGYEAFPFPFIYYALQFKNENIQRRIGQDIAWSSKLFVVQPTIVKYLYDAFDSHTDAVMTLLSETLIAVHPEMWTKSFANSWKKLKNNGKLFDRDRTACELYIKAGFRFIEDKATLYLLITDVLQALNEHPDAAITYLYHLNSNYLFKHKRKGMIPSALSKQIEEVIVNLSVFPENSLFALGNIFFLLTKQQKENAFQILKSFDFTQISNSRALRISLFFAQNNSEIIIRVKHAVLRHHELWATGINGKTITLGQQLLPLMQFTRRDNRQYGLTFDLSDIVTIFTKLKLALSDIRVVSSGRRQSFTDFASEISEMRVFLNHFKNELEHEAEFKSTLDEVNKMYIKNTGFSEIIDGLSNSEKSSVIWALAELSDQIEHKGFDANHVVLLLNKLVLQAGPSLEAGLNYLAKWINDKKNQEGFKVLSGTIIQILKKYRIYTLPEGDKPFVEEMVVRIAFALRKMAIKDSIINEVLNLDNIVFNNTRQWLTSKGKGAIEKSYA